MKLSRYYSKYHILCRQIFRLSFTVILLIFLLIVLLFPNSSIVVSQTSSTVVINEIMPHPSSGSDWIEIYNNSGADIDISGWSVSDSTSDPKGERIKTFPSGTVVEGDDPDGNNFYYFTVGNRLNDAGDVIKLYNPDSQPIDEKEYTGDPGIDNAHIRYPDGLDSWVITTKPTPGAKNVRQDPVTSSQDQQQAEPTISFTAPPSVTAGVEFSVTVNLSNFESGTYYIKVRVWQGESDKYGNTLGSSGWLTQGAEWSKFPTVSIPSSGSSSATVKAKVDDDAPAGRYEIQVRTHKDSENYDSPKKPLAVKAAPSISKESAATGTTVNSDNSGDTENSVTAVASSDEGQVLGEESNPKEEFQLNFYIIVGIFGLIVGSGGLILGFRYLKNSSVAAM